LDRHEQDCILPAFNADIAWELGQLLRKNALMFPKPVLINITMANGLVLFQTATRPGVIPDNANWVERKKRVVQHFDRSSYYMGRKIRSQGISLEQTFGLNAKDFAIEGGAFPLRVAGTEGIVAIVTVSGLQGSEDHMVSVNSFKEYLDGVRV
jgi:uncharacterized protein (UPF0303 family)